MNTITKNADQLQPGDIIPAIPGMRHRRVIVMVRTDGRCVMPLTCDLGEPSKVPYLPSAPVEQYVSSDKIEVEAPDLTPAQQHAEELLQIVRNVADMPNAPVQAKMARLVIDKIDPPNPPTYEELLASVKSLAKYINLDLGRLDTDERYSVDLAESNAGKLLDRARRCRMFD